MKSKSSSAFPRMPAERLTGRGTAEVGRFPGAAPPTRVELSIHKEDEKKQEEGGCRRWFWRKCLCCCKHPKSDSYDVTDKVELVKPAAPALPPAPESAKPKPENGDAREMEGEVADLWLDLQFENLELRSVTLYFLFWECDGG